LNPLQHVSGAAFYWRLKSDGKLYRESLETKVSIRLGLKFRLRHVATTITHLCVLLELLYVRITNAHVAGHWNHRSRRQSNKQKLNHNLKRIKNHENHPSRNCNGLRRPGRPLG
jgi:hypothetical protein